MSQGLTAFLRPEDEELATKRQELAELESELTERELYLADLENGLAFFEGQYLRSVGVLYAELDEIEAQIAELMSRKHAKDQAAQQAARQARETAEQSKAAVSEERLQEIGARVTPSQELKSLYREVAKRIHPDLATDPKDRALRGGLMAEANLAYEKGDAAKLRAILLEYEASPDAVKGEGAAADLVRVIRKIAQVKRRLVEIQKRIEELARTELFQLKQRVDAAREQGRDLLREMAENLKTQIADAKKRLASF